MPQPPRTPPHRTHTLTPLPISLKPRRRRLRRTRFHTRQATSKASSVRTDEESDFTQLASLSDTQVALELLFRQWPGQCIEDLTGIPPLALKTQLFSLVRDIGGVQQYLGEQVSSGQLREIRLPSGDHAYLRAQDYGIDDDFRRICKKMKANWVDNASVEEHCSESRVGELIRAGYLTMRDESSFWFALPRMGLFMKNRDDARKRLLSELKRKRYKEMLLEDLERIPLSGCCFTARWCVRDIVGDKAVECVDTSVGVVVRLSS